MVKKMVKISSMQEADQFNKLCSRFSCDMDLAKGKYYEDAKSIMGIFSLNLQEPVELIAGTEDEEEVNRVFASFIVS